MEDAEEEGRWEGRERTTKNYHCTVRGDDDYDDYAPPQLESEAAVTLSDAETVIPFLFGPRYAG